jgi:hypothetical protein
MMMLAVRYSALLAGEPLKAASVVKIIIVLERATHERIVRDIGARGLQSNYSLVPAAAMGTAIFQMKPIM